MSMVHKAYAFDWDRFAAELLGILMEALETNDPSCLLQDIDAHRAHLTDPYEGQPLPEDWRSRLEVGDIEELSDYALTRFYNPNQDCGLSEAWLILSDHLPESVQTALLGSPIGPSGRPFDPGRMGSYFQTPAQARQSLEAVATVDMSAIRSYRELLETCVQKGLGVYVTF